MTRHISIIVFFSLLVSSCISLMPEAKPGPDIYRLSVISEMPDIEHSRTMVLLPVIEAPRELRNNRVALVRQNHSIAYAASARWAASTPEMLQVLLADSFRAQGSIGIASVKDGVDTKLEVRVMLRNFEAVYDQGEEAAPLGVTAYRVHLIDRQTHTLLAEKNFRATQRANDLTLNSIVYAIDLAANDAAMQVVKWVANQVTEKESQ